MKMKRYIAVRTLKAVFKLGVVLVQAMFAIAADKPVKPKYSALQAQLLYDDGLIDEVEYARCTHAG